MVMPASCQAVANRRDGKARRVLHAIEALFFHRGDQFAVLHQGRRCVAVVGVDAENIHWSDSPKLFPGRTQAPGATTASGLILLHRRRI